MYNTHVNRVLLAPAARSHCYQGSVDVPSRGVGRRHRRTCSMTIRPRELWPPITATSDTMTDPSAYHALYNDLREFVRKF